MRISTNVDKAAGHSEELIELVVLHSATRSNGTIAPPIGATGVRRL